MDWMNQRHEDTHRRFGHRRGLGPRGELLPRFFGDRAAPTLRAGDCDARHRLAGPNGLSIMAVTPPAFLDLKEAAALLGVSEALFLRLVYQGKIQIAANALISEGKLYFLRTDLPHLKNKQLGS